MTPEYIKFIKSFLVIRCVMEYITIIHQDERDMMESMFDVSVWNRVFNQIHPLFQYYKNIMTSKTETIAYEQNRISTVYTQPTFHEYINSLLNLKTIGPADYQEFVNNMRTDAFRENMFMKHKKLIAQNTIKNHIIYLVNIYLMKQEGHIRFFTPEEEHDIDVMLNAIPYYDYISSNPDLPENDKDAHKYIQSYIHG